MSAIRGGTVQSPARSTDDFPFTAVSLVQSVYLWLFIMVSSEVKGLKNQIHVRVTMERQCTVFNILCARSSWVLFLPKCVTES